MNKNILFQTIFSETKLSREARRAKSLDLVKAKNCPFAANSTWLFGNLSVITY